MKSRSEKSYGARANNANKLLQILKSIDGYDPGTNGLYIADFEVLVNLSFRLNSEIAGELVQYSTEVENRQKLFSKDKDSLEKIVTPILGAVRSSRRNFPKDIAYMEAMGKKITGDSIKTNARDLTKKYVSQSERSFGSRTQTLSDIIDTLATYTPPYNPIKDNLKLPALKDKLIKLRAANSMVTTTHTTLTLKRDERAKHFDLLSTVVYHIKQAIQSQYLVNSPEYKLVKGITV